MGFGRGMGRGMGRGGDLEASVRKVLPKDEQVRSRPLPACAEHLRAARAPKNIIRFDN